MWRVNAKTMKKNGRSRWASHAVVTVVVVVFSCFALVRRGQSGEAELPVGSHPPALSVSHFPSRLHAFVWRNWGLVAPQRLAKVVGGSVDDVRRIATSMGLPGDPVVSTEMRQRGYITIVRRNWHLLPYEQLLDLLGMMPEELGHALREDDFLFIKLGSLKPRCEPISYRPPDAPARRRAAEIKQLVERRFPDLQLPAEEKRFAFIERLSRPQQTERGSSSGEASRHDATDGTAANGVSDDRPAGERLRLIYSYFGSYGDPLVDASLDPYPDGLLQRLARMGVNGVWLHVVLRQLAPGGTDFPEFGVGHERRLANLRRLVARARRYGIGVYLYLNEPRAMPADFFERHPGVAGVREGGFAAMCTSTPSVRRWLSDSLAYVFEKVPELGGVFTITASENLTHCASHFRHSACPRCGGRDPAEIVAEVVATVAKGVHRSAPQARVIAWDWGWNRHGDASQTIARLPDDVELMSVSEWAKPFQRGGVAGRVGEYSISVVGPGPRATRHWALAKQRGLRALAKVQLNNTWELSAVPYLPVLDLVAQHCANLRQADVDGMMLSWTLGGYPSPNLEVAHRFDVQPNATADRVLDALAAQRYGKLATATARRAWRQFSEAFQQFPFDGAVLYRGPQQFGPANLLYIEPTGYRSTMIGFPYDDVDGWRGRYPAEVLAEQFDRVANGWQKGIETLEAMLETVPKEKRAEAESDLRLARAAGLHFASAGNQVRFFLARNRWLAEDTPRDVREALGAELRRLLDREAANAHALYALARRDSRIGFEASNHYYYVPLDLVEKVIHCQYARLKID